MISIYDYIDYRRFLTDRFLEQKRKNPSFSYRAFNRLAGIKSSGFLLLVTRGKRNLGDDGIRCLSKGLGLSEEDKKYFETLVRFNQARDVEEKNRHFKELTQNKKFIAAKPVTAAQYRLFSHWYYVAILEVVRIDTDEIKDVKWLEKQINPSVKLRNLKRAVKELKELGLLVQDANGNLKRQEAMLTTEDVVRSVSVANFHVQMSEMAIRAVLKEKARDREFSSLTIVTSEKSFEKAKEEIRKFRKHLHSILEQENEGPKTLVAHMNFQLFKLSQPRSPV